MLVFITCQSQEAAYSKALPHNFSHSNEFLFDWEMFVEQIKWFDKDCYHPVNFKPQESNPRKVIVFESKNTLSIKT